MKNFIGVVCVLLLTNVASAADAEKELCVAEQNDCTFVLLSERHSEQVTETINATDNSLDSDKIIQSASVTEESETLLVINQQRAKQQFSPFSTFKIPNSLIAIDTQVVESAEQSLRYDKEKYPMKKWWPSRWKLADYNLSSAFQHSMVPIYRQLATEIGQETMQSYLDNFTYGNQDISSGLDSFWLAGSMQISAMEQVEFLQRLHHNQLGVKPQSIALLKEIMLAESTDSYKLYAKTGAGKAIVEAKKTKAMLGWYVGFVENAQGVHYFAFNFTRDSYAKMKASRIVIVRNHLKKAGII